MSFYVKDPGATLDYVIDWSPFPAGQSIAASEWSVAPQEGGGIAVRASGADKLRTIARLRGGRAGRGYRVANRVTLSDGSVNERSIALRVEGR
jgi:hypothetical protein